MPAIAAGCTVVPSPATRPHSVFEVRRGSRDDAGPLPGVVNLVSGPGAVIGERLAEHSDVDVVLHRLYGRRRLSG